MQKNLFFLLIHGAYHNICRSYKYYSPYTSWTGKNQDIAEILATNGLWSAELRWGFGNLDPQVSFSWAVSEGKIFRTQPIRNKNCMWRPCLLTDQDKMSNLHRGPSIYMLPTKFRFIWPCSFRGVDFLEISQSETRIACGGHVC